MNKKSEVNGRLIMIFLIVISIFFIVTNLVTSAPITDKTAPSVSDIEPMVGTVVLFNKSANIRATVTDTENAVDAVVATITIPSSKQEQLLLEKQKDVYNYSFPNTTTEGNYTVVFTANDTVGNINDTESTIFIVDITGPAVTTIGLGDFAVQTNGTIAKIQASVTDASLSVDVVLVNITYPDNTTKEQLLLEKQSWMPSASASLTPICVPLVQSLLSPHQ